MVARINDVRTARRSSMASDSSAGRKSRRRDQSADVWREGSLRLEPDEVCDRGLGGHRLPVEQELAGEQCPVERALAEHRAQR